LTSVNGTSCSARHELRSRAFLFIPSSLLFLRSARYPQMPLPLMNHSALALFAQRTRIPTSARSIGFCVIWVCISSSSSSHRLIEPSFPEFLLQEFGFSLVSVGFQVILLLNVVLVNTGIRIFLGFCRLSSDSSSECSSCEHETCDPVNGCVFETVTDFDLNFEEISGYSTYLVHMFASLSITSF